MRYVIKGTIGSADVYASGKNFYVDVTADMPIAFSSLQWAALRTDDRSVAQTIADRCARMTGAPFRIVRLKSQD